MEDVNIREFVKRLEMKNVTNSMLRDYTEQPWLYSSGQWICVQPLTSQELGQLHLAWLRPKTVSALSLPCGLRVLERTVNFCLLFFFFTDPVFLKLQKYKRELYFRNSLGALIYMYTMWCKTVKKCARAKHQIERLKKITFDYYPQG